MLKISALKNSYTVNVSPKKKKKKSKKYACFFSCSCRMSHCRILQEYEGWRIFIFLPCTEIVRLINREEKIRE